MDKCPCRAAKRSGVVASSSPPLMQVVQDDCTDMGLAVQMGLADTRGAAWALARFAGRGTDPDRSGDAIDQEARASVDPQKSHRPIGPFLDTKTASAGSPMQPSQTSSK